MGDNDVERRMWQLLKRRANNKSTQTVRISKLACNQLPVNKKRATQLVKKWENRGLVTSFQNGARAMLTESGVITDDPEQPLYC